MFVKKWENGEGYAEIPPLTIWAHEDRVEIELEETVSSPESNRREIILTWEQWAGIVSALNGMQADREGES